MAGKPNKQDPVDSTELAAELGLSAGRINSLYAEREKNDFPAHVDQRGRARLWDLAEVRDWYESRKPSRLQELSLAGGDPDELLNAAQVARVLGYKHRSQITTYLAEHPGYFPEPDEVEELGTYKRQKWRRRTIAAWRDSRPGKGKRTGSTRQAPALPDVPTDGNPEELLSGTQAAALLGFKSLNSFSSSLSQGNLPLLEETDGLSDRGRRAWTRRRILEQRAQRGR
ncbi:helix-turn-helix transcriptional regulator [Streptomyces sp. NPDC056738]|uniref:helix-turn-helix transcriptional regulator n=1 Tax=Streptomyces sp. NPDC056738 TaxID=3345933 RepID=UPI00369BC918